ncbi:13982_t:CDS:1, partial [Acaulospora colombiana]
IWTEFAIMRLLDLKGEDPMIYEEIDCRTKLAMLIGDILTTPDIRIYP